MAKAAQRRAPRKRAAAAPGVAGATLEVPDGAATRAGTATASGLPALPARRAMVARGDRAEMGAKPRSAAPVAPAG